jgi:hypothetical protein
MLGKYFYKTRQGNEWQGKTSDLARQGEPMHGEARQCVARRGEAGRIWERQGKELLLNARVTKEIWTYVYSVGHISHRSIINPAPPYQPPVKAAGRLHLRSGKPLDRTEHAVDQEYNIIRDFLWRLLLWWLSSGTRLAGHAHTDTVDHGQAARAGKVQPTSWQHTATASRPHPSAGHS